MGHTEIRRPLVWLGILALVGLAVVPYLATLRYPLLHDDRTLFDNPWLQREAGLPSVFAREYWHGTRHAQSDLYRPVTILSLAWNLRLAPSTTGLRAVNFALHALVCLLAWWCLWRVFETLGASRTAAPFPSGGVAWAGAALFAVHPLASEAVVFLVGRAELLAAAGGLAALGLLAGRAPRWSDPRLWLSTALLFLALCSKESAAAWLPILALWALLARSTAALRGLAGWSGALAAFLLLRASVVGWLPHAPPWIDNPLAAHDAATRAANAVLVHLLYLRKMVWPAGLSIEHGYDQVRVLPLVPWGLVAAASATLAWLVVAWWLRRRSTAALFLWAAVPVAFAVTGNVLFPIGAIHAERLAYLPLVPACGLVAHLSARLRWPRVVALILLAGAVLAAEARTMRRTGDYRDHDTLVRATARTSPRAVKALVNLARLELREGRIPESIATLERATKIWPDYPRALALLAEAYERSGNPARAREYRRRAEEAFERL